MSHSWLIAPRLDTLIWTEYVESRIATALALAEGQCGGSYSDACILLSAILSGISAQIWPGKAIDMRRFVQSWVQFADSSLSPTLMSVPLLVQQLRAEGKSSEAQVIENARPGMFGFGYQTMILRGADVDLSDSEVIQRVPTLGLRDVRRFSYAAAFYEHVRSNLSHEWKLSPKAAGVAMTRFPSGVSYVNRVDNTNMAISKRLIHFHVEWIARITRSIAANTSSLIEKYQTLALPQKWWVDGR